MTIEEDIFKRSKVDFKKLKDYGFLENDKGYLYSKLIMNNKFRVDITIDYQGKVTGKIYDLSFQEEYTNFRIEASAGYFIAKLKKEFITVLEDIKNKCFINEYFIYAQSNRITNLIKEKYGDNPNFEWEKYPGYATFKNKETNKWYGIIMNIDKSKLDCKLKGEVEIIDIKLDKDEIKNLLKVKGYYPAYHMNKQNWLTIILDDTLSDEEIMNLVAKSYSYALKK